MKYRASWPPEYEFEVEPELTTEETKRIVSVGWNGSPLVGERVLVRVTPHSRSPVVAAFRSGDFGLTLAIESPTPTALCVVARGTGYLFDCTEPLTTLTLNCYPIQNYAIIHKHRLLLLTDFSDLCILGPERLIRYKRELFPDGLRFGEVTEETIELIGYVPSKEREDSKRLDVLDLLDGH
jgi:hypothetical protein